MRGSLRLLLIAALGLGASACGDDTNDCNNAADGVCPAGCSLDPDCTAGDGGMDSDAGPSDNGVRYDEAFTEDCSVDRCDTRTHVETACTCTQRPSQAPPSMPTVFDINRVGCAQLTAGGDGMRTPEDDSCDGSADNGAPALSCMMEGSYREASESASITLVGVVDVFGNGGDADAITVEVYREGENGALGEMLGTAVASTDHPCSQTEDEIDNDMVVGTRALGFYSIPNIPSNTPLIVKTSGNGSFWRPIYSYNVNAVSEEIETGAPGDNAECDAYFTENVSGDYWDYRARILSTSDWVSIPLTAGLTDGIRSTSGVIAGEVHDCDDVRIEFAQVGVSPAPEVLTYFNDNADNPLPQPTRREGTSLLGLYAALDVPEGPVNIAAVGRVGGETVSLGWYRAQVFPGAVTSLTLRGLRATQVPQD